MIIGLSATTTKAKELVQNALKDTWNFRIISEAELIQVVGLENMINNSTMKMVILSNLSTFGINCVISSNIFLDAKTAQWLADLGGTILVVVDEIGVEPRLIEGYLHQWRNISVPKCLWSYDSLQVSLEKSVKDTFIRLNPKFNDLNIMEAEHMTNEEIIKKAMSKLGLGEPDIPRRA